MSNKKEITLKMVEEAIEHVFTVKPREKRGEETVLKVYQDDKSNRLAFSFGPVLLTGLGGFLSLNPVRWQFDKVIFNDVELNKEQLDQFWEQTYKMLQDEKL